MDNLYVDDIALYITKPNISSWAVEDSIIEYGNLAGFIVNYDTLDVLLYHHDESNIEQLRLLKLMRINPKYVRYLGESNPKK